MASVINCIHSVIASVEPTVNPLAVPLPTMFFITLPVRIRTISLSPTSFNPIALAILVKPKYSIAPLIGAAIDVATPAILAASLFDIPCSFPYAIAVFQVSLPSSVVPAAIPPMVPALCAFFQALARVRLALPAFPT